MDAWDYFGLSYASWLVLPRVALQSMSPQWQAQFFALVQELTETLEYPEGYTDEFTVIMRKGNKFVKNVFPHYRHHMLPNKEKDNERTNSISS